MTRTNFTCIKLNKCAYKKRFKTQPKQSLAYRVSMPLHYLLVVVNDVKVMSSGVAVIFAVN